MYKFLAIGNDRDGLVQYFGRGQRRQAEQACRVLTDATGLPSGTKNIEMDERQVLILMNAAIALTKIAGARTKGDSNAN